MNPALLGISITTRNRWGDLEKTLSIIGANAELNGCPVIVIDDGSDNPAPRALVEQYANVQFLPSGRKLGMSAQRTKIAQLLTTEFLLQLDDDSYPVEGSVLEAVAFLAGRPDVVALALNVFTRGEASPTFDPSEAPHAVDRFIGCGVLFRRQMFLELGGFFGPLNFYFEESHFCARAIREGRAIYLFPSLVIRHEKVSSARNMGKIAYYKGRNRVLLVLWYYPLKTIPFRLATSLPGTFALVRPRDYPAAMVGFLMGLFDGIRMLGQRRPLSSEQFRSWRNLPSCYYPRNAVASR